jgi:PRC-barrel domain
MQPRQQLALELLSAAPTPSRVLAPEEMIDMRGIGPKLLAGAALLLGAGLAMAQTTPPTPQPSPPAAMTPDTSKITLTEEQAKSWIDKPVFSSDGKELGDVAEFKRAADNTVLEMRADIGGFLGFGRTRISLMPAQFKLQDNRVVLSLTEKQAKDLPRAKN